MRLTALIWRLLAILLACVGLVRASESDQTVFPPSNGARIRIEAVSPVLHDHTATLLRATDDTLWIGQGDEQAWPAIGRTDPRPQAVPVRSVTSLEVWQLSKSRAHHALVGAGAGALIGGIGSGLVAYSMDDGSHGDDPITPYAAAGGLAGGLLVGTAVGLLWPTGKWLNVALPEKTSPESPGGKRSETGGISPTQPADFDHATFPPLEGARVRVYAVSPLLNRQVATVMAGTTDTLRIGEPGRQTWVVPVSSITRIEAWRPIRSRGHSAYVGAKIGALAGGAAMALASAIHKGGTSGAAYGAAFGALTGAAAGAAVGALRRTGEWLNVAIPEKVSFGASANDRVELKLTVRRL
jgi:hypothetical protein